MLLGRGLRRGYPVPSMVLRARSIFMYGFFVVYRLTIVQTNATCPCDTH